MDSVLRGLAVYFVLLLVTRLSGRRALAEMTPFDFVLILIVAETTQQALLGEDYSIVNAAILILTLFTTDIGLSYVKRRFRRIAKVVDGTPTLLVCHGQPLDEVMRKVRVDIDDVLQAGREQHGLERLDQIEFAVLEIGSRISIIPARQR
jgi:uncharacterized membrane protein YcaP (DUF421 family)